MNILINVYDYRWRRFKNFIFKNSLYILEILKKENIFFSVDLVNDKIMRFVNNEYRQKDYTTNVLAFCSGNNTNYLGEIFLCFDQIKKEFSENRSKNSMDYTNSFHDYSRYLLIHAILHLLGYDHNTKDETDKMEDLENKIFRTLKTSYDKTTNR